MDAQQREPLAPVKFPEFDPEQALADLEQLRRNEELLNSIKARLLEEHGDCWVAIYEGEVAAIDQTLAGVEAQLDRAGIGRGVLLELLQKNPPVLIL